MFTKYDTLTEDIERKWVLARRNYTEAEVDEEADQYIKGRCIQRIKELTGQKDIPYIAVSCESIIFTQKLSQIIFIVPSKVPLPGEADTTDRSDLQESLRVFCGTTRRRTLPSPRGHRCGSKSRA